MVKKLHKVTQYYNSIGNSKSNKTYSRLFRIAIVVCGVFMVTSVSSQNVDLDNLDGFIGKGKPFKVSGAIAANSIFYNSSQASGREAFSYFLQGSLNVSFMAISVPVSYSYSNQGSQLEY